MVARFYMFTGLYFWKCFRVITNYFFFYNFQTICMDLTDSYLLQMYEIVYGYNLIHDILGLRV